MFEYPRLPAATTVHRLVQGTHRVDHLLADRGRCHGWEKRFGGQFRHDLQLNPTANPRWKRAHEFFLKQPGDPMPAVRDLFTPSKRFDQRNFLMCDHVIDALHLEALARVKSKRDGKTTWFKAITDVESDGWLRIIHPSLVDDDPGGVAFLVGEREPRFFERKKIPVEELEVGRPRDRLQPSGLRQGQGGGRRLASGERPRRHHVAPPDAAGPRHQPAAVHLDPRPSR